MEEESKKPGFEERFTKSIEEGQKRRKLLFESQRPEEESYGYSSDNPIMTSTISSTNEYLSRLRTLDGKGFTWNRTQAYCMKNVGGVDGVWVDVYQLFLNGQEYKVLYICPYGHQSPYAPKGMVLATIE